MPRPAASQPTEVELAILRILWSAGSATARAIHNSLQEDRATTYSTTVKMLAVMLDKGLIRRDEDVTPFVYRATESRKRASRKILNDMITKVYDGSAMSLVLQALAGSKATKDEIAEARRLLDELDQS